MGGKKKEKKKKKKGEREEYYREVIVIVRIGKRGRMESLCYLLGIWTMTEKRQKVLAQPIEMPLYGGAQKPKTRDEGKKVG